LRVCRDADLPVACHQYKEEIEMKKSSLITAILVALSLAVVPACKKKKADDQPATEDTTGAAKPADMPASDPAATGGTMATDPAAAGATDPAAAGASNPAAAGATDPAAAGAAGATDPAAAAQPAEGAGAGGATEVQKDEEKQDEGAKKTGEGGW
jgi:hypothetical protein